MNTYTHIHTYTNEYSTCNQNKGQSLKQPPCTYSAFCIPTSSITLPSELMIQLRNKFRFIKSQTILQRQVRHIKQTCNHHPPQMLQMFFHLRHHHLHPLHHSALDLEQQKCCPPGKRERGHKWLTMERKDAKHNASQRGLTLFFFPPLLGTTTEEKTHLC